MVITSNGSTILQRNNIDGTPAYRAPEKIKKTKENEVNIRAYPIGKLFIIDENGRAKSCTASVINTDNGNIGLTAAHCLVKDDGTRFDTLYFSPGYDSGATGPLDIIDVKDVAVPYTFLVDHVTNDYGLASFVFDDPDGGNATLQDYTGALGWRFDIENNTLTNIFGYPNSGTLENCTKNGLFLCEWQGHVLKDDEDYIVSDVDIGQGASGAPFIYQYNISTNLGYVYATFNSYDRANDDSLGTIYNSTIFLGLISRLS
ncbi:hypothetical protein C2G38_2248452 [Gigaspora rosea]|uniref:Trypsin-like cysteine/serine peptidase domain-containing protein n=1 Tax=Gigaspora rosea TaxID=44941 RepID=A0A397V2G2_9GLOM|nr:hypothetical protein C2G38_2248452 [Gigaspora rosea]